MIGDRIRARRRELGLTQEQLAAGLFDRSYISRIEANEVVPPLATLRLLAERLGKPVGFFLGEQDEFARRRVIHDYVQRGRRYTRKRRFGEAVRAFRMALELLEQDEDSPLLLSVQVDLAYALACLNQAEEAGRCLFAALNLLARVPLDRCPPGTTFRLHYTRGKLAFQRDELAVAAEAFRLAASAAGRPADRIRAHVALASTLFRQGHYREALAYYATGLPDRERPPRAAPSSGRGHARGSHAEAAASATLGDARGSLVEPAAAPTPGNARSRSEPAPEPAGVPAAPGQAGAGGVPPARASAPAPVPVPVRHLPSTLIAACHHGVGVCYCALNQLDLAAYHLERAIQLYRGRDPARVLTATHDLGVVQARQGAWRLGRQRLRQCLAGYRRIGRLDGVASVLVDLANLELAAGRHRRALVLARIARCRARQAQRPRLYLSAMAVEARALDALDPSAARALDGVVRDLRALG
ncbi:helix-turn-helix transcriptional regulator [Thermaerobacter composti]|uniref:Helix-turn-helix transcriptional regulator n=1 Tax=Thermaerobacter composti TaxID=554949 RepID=A0ABZ0QQN1_9FIRM|nr:helix-turn-helix transcriptional regulator [Thermaerobacter composti]WPD19579.1 helix-turn-helix transcriptional regulator [Thermaerobacter composti]